MTERIIIGSDHGGFGLKGEIIEHLKELGYQVSDLGCYSVESCDYPPIAKAVAKEVLDTNGRGILVCGTGIGMSIAANSNMLCLGERITGSGLALDIVDIWLKTEFEGGRHKKRIDMI